MPDQPFPFLHITLFTLADRSLKTRTRFIEACHKYLSNHKGQTHFSVSVRATEVERAVVDKDYDVAMVMMFENKDYYNAYATDPRHEEYITVVAGMSISRRVFDSYILPAPKING